MPEADSTSSPVVLITGASRGIGHATVKRFSSAGWRVITCSRHAFPEDCPWEAGPEDHLQIDLADTESLDDRVAELRRMLDGGPLEIEWRADGHVLMTGPVAVSFSGFIEDESGA